MLFTDLLLAAQRLALVELVAVLADDDAKPVWTAADVSKGQDV